MTLPLDRTNPLFQFRITRRENTVEIWHNGATKTYMSAAISELTDMLIAFRAGNHRELKNFADLPTRTPLHANTITVPRKATLDDLA